MIHIFLASDNNYTQHLAVTMASVLANTEEYCKFYILDSGISEDNKNKLLELKSIRDFDIEFVSINLDMFKDCPLCRHTLNTYSRMKIPELFPDVDKAIYLDCDIVVRSDIAEFWNFDINGYCLGVVKDSLSFSRAKKHNEYFKKLGINANNYFNNGVSLMNLDELHKFEIYKKSVKWFKENTVNIRYSEQDAYNVLLADRVRFLPVEWNTSPDIYRKLKNKYFKKYNISPKIIHYTTAKKPWFLESVTYFKDEYYKYLALTPWKEYTPVSIATGNFWKKLNLKRKVIGRYFKFYPLFLFDCKKVNELYTILSK